MADSKKYDGSQWEHSLRKLTTATEAVENPLYSDGTAITSYTIKGNTVQSGTPTPANPVEVNGVGKRTENLFDKGRTQGIIANTYINQSGQQIVSPNYYVSYPIGVNEGDVYTWSFHSISGISHTAPTVAFYDANDEMIGVASHSANITHFTFTVPNNTKYIRASVYTGASQNSNMLLEGSTTTPDETPLDYIPYGYKIPILTTQGSAVNYLGSVQTVRQIQKLVLKGDDTEIWSMSDSTFGKRFSMTVSGARQSDTSQVTTYCTHLPLGVAGATYSQTDTYTITAASVLYVSRDSTFTSIADFKAWLSDQYANGTPVTVWYVLATPTTGIVNEPLMKISTYADTLSNATAIPTTEGANSISVDTTVQPSEFTATWTGWHNAYVKEKSENLFDISTAMQGKQYDDRAQLIDTTDNWYATDYIPVTGGETYIRSVESVGIGSVYNEYNNQKQFIGRYTPTYGTPFTVGQNTAYITFSINSNSTAIDNYMLNEGQTALPYEPYWK